MDGGVHERRRPRPRPRAGSSGRRVRRSAPAPRASTSCTWPAAGARSPASPSRRSTSGRRRSTWPGRSSRRRRAADVGAVIFELARSEQTYTFQRPMDYATLVLAGAIAAGWRHPVFIQGDHYQFNAKKYAADPEAMTEEIRRACRLAIDAGYRNIDIDSSTLVDLSKPNRRRGAARELHARGRADRAHPQPRAGRRHGQRRRRDRRGRQAELDGRRARGVPRRVHARARRPRTGRDRAVQGQRPDRHVARRRPAARAAAWPRSSWTSRCSAQLGEIARARTGSPAPCSTARRRCPTSCSTISRRSRRPRSTSRPASRTRCTTTRRSPPR